MALPVYRHPENLERGYPILQFPTSGKIDVEFLANDL
jgi:hypothetical protein